jgi:hypothetical protein
MNEYKINMNVGSKMKRKIPIALFLFALIFAFSPATTTYAVPATGINNYCIYNIINSNSSKYLNVHLGYDVNNTNVYQWSNDGAIEQRFKAVYDASEDAYRLYAMSSSNGTNKVLDIVKLNGAVVSGCNVQIYNPVDDVA